jgi:hypothetical protein
MVKNAFTSLCDTLINLREIYRRLRQADDRVLHTHHAHAEGAQGILATVVDGVLKGRRGRYRPTGRRRSAGESARATDGCAAAARFMRCVAGARDHARTDFTPPLAVFFLPVEYNRRLGPAHN